MIAGFFEKEVITVAKFKVEFYGHVSCDKGKIRDIFLYRELEMDVIPQKGTHIKFEDERGANGSVFVEKINQHVNTAGNTVKVVVYNTEVNVDVKKLDILQEEDDENTILKLIGEIPVMLGLQYIGWKATSISGSV